MNPDDHTPRVSDERAPRAATFDAEDAPTAGTPEAPAANTATTDHGADSQGTATAGSERRAALVHVLCGVAMGSVDVIPGVSGGTVALILGIYDRLVVALSHFDRHLLRQLARRDWRAAARHLDLGFLLPLGLGISAGVLSLASAMHWLLVHHPRETNAVFFGLILSSSMLVARMVPHWKPAALAALVIGALFAFWLVGLEALEHPPEGLAYLFFSGVVAICAMILPGISGSFILLLLGKYVYVTGLVRQLLHLQWSGRLFVEVTVFALGCLVGLLAFSRLLRWLLATHASVTTAALCGFMLGSLRKLWPFEAAPDMTTGHTHVLLGLALGAGLLVLAVDALSRRRRA